MQDYTAIVKRQTGWWFGWIEEIPGVNCQERTREKLLDSLRETLREAIDMNREEARRSADEGYLEVKVSA